MVMDVENEVLRGAPRPAEPLWGWPREALAAGNTCLRGNARCRRRRSRELDCVEGEQQLAPFPAGLKERKLARVFVSVNGGGRESCDSADLFEIHQLRRKLRSVDGHERSRSKPSPAPVKTNHRKVASSAYQITRALISEISPRTAFSALLA